VVRAATFTDSGSKWFRRFAVDAMSGSDRDRLRKYKSGAAKAKIRNLREEIDKTLKGALDKYFPKEAVNRKRILIWFWILASHVRRRLRMIKVKMMVTKL
jgi:hypothetical protein